MVILTHILHSSLSNSQTSLTLIIEDSSFAGLGRLFLLNAVRGIQSDKEILISDRSFQTHFASSTPIYPPYSISKSILETSKVLCIDSLEYAIWIFGEQVLYDSIKNRVRQNLGTLIVANKSYINSVILNNYCLLSEIIANIGKFSKNKGVVNCTHIRGLTKHTQESNEFEVVGELVREAKIERKKQSSSPFTTFRLDVNEEEKKMREVTPLPYENKERLISVDEENYVSPDEEGDEDDYY